MSLTIDFWQLVGILVGLVTTGLGALVSIMKLGVAQAQKYQDAAAKQAKERQDESQTQLLRRLDSLELANQGEASQWRQFERDFLLWKGELPNLYVRREDYIRGQTVLETKLDKLGLQLANAQLRGTIGGNNAT